MVLNKLADAKWQLNSFVFPLCYAVQVRLSSKRQENSAQTGDRLGTNKSKDKNKGQLDTLMHLFVSQTHKCSVKLFATQETFLQLSQFIACPMRSAKRGDYL